MDVVRMELLEGVPILALSEEVLELADYYHRELGLTGRAAADVPHFAYSVAYDIDYLLTWNCSHIANRTVMDRLRLLNDRINRATPDIRTPADLMMNTEHDDE
jgi:hypothetical protein